MIVWWCPSSPRTTRKSVTLPYYDRVPTYEQLYAGEPRDTAPYWEHGSSRIHRTCRSRRPQRATGAAVAGDPQGLRGPMDNNAYLLTCRSTGAQLLIDAAADEQRLLALVAEGSAEGRLDTIVTTHC